ncbi:50S ribosomal protein L18 [Candidatus Contubernalis alkaliaceticus]|uniref:50S ribosomal protein L18 n=1 Tax=Candidatus Contubernalis alkaliaceticus TaxID=338645 RepID=UPI002409F1C1|nr:50S ribosomal protein L18 [Candidatus Contubernalis alkalaceticus]
MFRKESRNLLRKKRHMRIRSKISGTADQPRLNVFRSSSQIYAQIIDDLSGTTVVSASSLDHELAGKLEGLDKKGKAKKVGELLAQRALDKGVQTVIFDRGGYRYHGRVKSLADGAREVGLKF